MPEALGCFFTWALDPQAYGVRWQSAIIGPHKSEGGMSYRIALRQLQFYTCPSDDSKVVKASADSPKAIDIEPDELHRVGLC